MIWRASVELVKANGMFSLSTAWRIRGISSISSWQHPQGGFSGGPYQLAHLAPTYAAVNSLAILGSNEAMDVIDR